MVFSALANATTLNHDVEVLEFLSPFAINQQVEEGMEFGKDIGFERRLLNFFEILACVSSRDRACKRFRGVQGQVRDWVEDGRKRVGITFYQLLDEIKRATTFDT